jgi:hypothetical protein
MARGRAGVAAGMLAMLALTMPAGAASSQINAFSATSSGSIAFTVNGLSSPLLAGSQSYGFSLNFRSSPTPGTISVTAPSIVGTGGNSIRAGAFHALCSATSDSSGLFTSSGTVQLSSSAVTCGTIAANGQETLAFRVTLYLDDTTDATCFTADTYTAASLVVTVNLP